jgi:2-dehydropantoate 2-reductase
VHTPGQNNLSIAILGAGAVGGFLAAVLSRNGASVTCIVKEPASGIISKEGIRLESGSFGDFIVWPNVITQLNFSPDVLFITTKATTLNKAVERVDPVYVKDTIIIPLLNGIEHIGYLRSIYGKQVIAGSIGNIEVKKVSANRIVHTTISAKIDIAPNKDVSVQKLNTIVKLLSGSGIKVDLLESENEVVWAKLVRLCALACTTSAIDRTVGFIRDDKKWWGYLEACVREAAAVAQADGTHINVEEVLAQIKKLPKEIGTSMQRDINAGRPSELDAIAGAVIRIGKKHGLNCPAIKSLTDIIEMRSIDVAQSIKGDK